MPTSLPATAADLIPDQSALFDLPDEVTFLNCANLSPQLKSVTEAGVQAVRQKGQPWLPAPHEWFEVADEVRSAAGRLMGADADGIAIIPAVSYGVAIAAANLRVERGQNIVLLHEQFPSNFYSWRDVARERGGELRAVRRDSGDDWTAAVVSAIDENTAVVTVPNVHWTDGALVDLAAVSARSHEVGAALVIDASQSLAVYPLDVEALDPDFVVSVGYKWQMGPYSLGYLYASRRWREEGRPLESSWLSRAGAEDWASLVNYRDDLQPGARRFDMGEFPQLVLAPMALAGLRQVLEWGVDSIQATTRHLTDLIADRATELGCTVLPRDKRCGHIVGLRVPGGLPPELPPRMAAERVYVSIRGDIIRLGPYLYNTPDDVERFFEIFREYVRSEP